MPTVRTPILQITEGAEGVIPPPSGVQPDDLLLAFLAFEANIWDATLTGGSPEWQPLTSAVTDNTTTYGILATGIWWKPASAADTTWQIGRTSGNPPGIMAMAVAAISAAPLQAPAVTDSGEQKATSDLTTITSPAGPAAAVGDLELRWVAGDHYVTSAVRSWTPPGSVTELADISSNYITAELTAQTLTTASSPSRNHSVSPGVLAARGMTVRVRAVSSPGRPLTLQPAVHRAATW
ncbi:hypothetical protein ABZ815_20255 [Nonomuraea sp. NPDC047529]|uniref:hypothetical protein n=1 Tax=Nonomuraea sp. NPDC047529 TaxID=3155623 RepID=UPI0033F201A2